MSSNLERKDPIGRKGRRPGFDKRLVMRIVLAIENGLPRSEAVIKYGISRSTVSDWMREYGSQAYKASKPGHLSLQQRRSVVRAIQEGRMTVAEAKLAYNLRWTGAIIKWLRDEKRENGELVSFTQTIMANKEDAQQSAAAPTIKTLEQALKELEEEKLKVKALNTLIDIAEENFKISIRKKAGAKQSSE